jgi:hypothetical protein
LRTHNEEKPSRNASIPSVLSSTPASGIYEGMSLASASCFFIIPIIFYDGSKQCCKSLSFFRMSYHIFNRILFNKTLELNKTSNQRQWTTIEAHWASVALMHLKFRFWSFILQIWILKLQNLRAKLQISICTDLL